MVMKFLLRYYGDPILRKKAIAVVEINDEIKILVQNMIEIINSVLKNQIKC